MKIMNVVKKYGQKVAVGSALLVGSAAAMAADDGISSIGTTMATEIAKVIPVVSAVGMGLLSVYVVMLSYDLIASKLRRK